MRLPSGLPSSHQEEKEEVALIPSGGVARSASSINNSRHREARALIANLLTRPGGEDPAEAPPSMAGPKVPQIPRPTLLLWVFRVDRGPQDQV